MTAYAGYIFLFLLGMVLALLFLLFIITRRHFLLKKFKKECARARILSDAADHVSRLYEIDPNVLKQYPCVTHYLGQSKILIDYYIFFDSEKQSALSVVPIYEKDNSSFNFNVFIKEVVTVDQNIKLLLNDVSKNIAIFYKTEHPVSYFVSTSKKKLLLQILSFIGSVLHIISKSLNLLDNNRFPDEVYDEMERDAIKV